MVKPPAPLNPTTQRVQGLGDGFVATEIGRLTLNTVALGVVTMVMVMVMVMVTVVMVVVMTMVMMVVVVGQLAACVHP